MNILEDQVTDLAYLADSPLAITGIMNGNERPSPGRAESPPTAGDGDSPNAKRRKGSDTVHNGVVTHTRAKRNRYISIACNECKRRKIKCNGETPCLRCGNLNLECQYAPNCCSGGGGFKESDEFRQMNAHITSLQEQVDNLYASMNALRNNSLDGINYSVPPERSIAGPQNVSLPPISPMTRYRPTDRPPSFRGPTSTAFSLDVAKNTLHNMGYQNLGDEGQGTREATPTASPRTLQPIPLAPSISANAARDPIWSISRDEMLRLCRVYEEEIGIMYPIIEIEPVIAHTKYLYDFVAPPLKAGVTSAGVTPLVINDLPTSILKLVLATAITTEKAGKSDVGDSLFESVRQTADRYLHNEAVDVKSLPLLVLVAMYHFHVDEEGLAWRVVGQAARMCVELGLHRRESLFKVVPDEKERGDVVKLIWSIYVLDRRWSFGTGLPFALQDADIDPNLPEPSSNVPYLNAMIRYSQIGSRVWRSISSFSPNLVPGPTLNTEDIGYFDYQILQWQKSIPPELQLSANVKPASRAIHRLQVLLYLRMAQMRILIYRPVLHSASSIQENMNYANLVVQLAKDTIQALTHLNQTTDIYRAQQVCFNYFLISALAVLFLASCHAPVHFSSLCRSEFYMALDLVKGFSNKSWVSKRLWKTIRGLKEVGPKLGLSPIPGNGNMGDNMEDPHSSAALAMAGLAGHEISGLAPHFMGQEGTGLGSSIAAGNIPMSGYQMSHEMTNLFEAALGSVGMNGNGNINGTGAGTNGGGSNGYGISIQEGGDNGGANGMAGVGSDVFGGDEELYRQLRDLF